MHPPEPQAATREQHMEQHPLLQTDLEAPQRFRGLFHTAGGDTNQDKNCTVTAHTDTNLCPKALRGSAVWAGHDCTRVR